MTLHNNVASTLNDPKIWRAKVRKIAVLTIRHSFDAPLQETLENIRANGTFRKRIYRSVSDNRVSIDHSQFRIVKVKVLVWYVP